VKISRAAMKAAQGAKQQKAGPVKGRKIIFFQTIKSISCQTGAFFYLIFCLFKENLKLGFYFLEAH
jgi:hypothetical protein